MLTRKGVTLALVAAVAASASVALAEAPTLTLADATAAPRAPLMAGLDRLGAASTLDKYGLNIYGWVEAGYSYNHRRQTRESSVTGDAPKVWPGVFNHEAGDTMMLNQVVLRFERTVDTKKFDVGGMIEIMYGQDAAGIHASGLGYNGDDPSQSSSEKGGAGDRYHPNYQFDIVQAYVDVAPGVPGLKIRAGKFVTLLGYEYINPNQNAFYSHSYLFSSIPFTHVGVVAFYDINDQWHVAGGITRGWDIATEDNNKCAVDGIFRIGYTPNKAWSFYLNGTVGPEKIGDSSHYRIAIDPVVTWAVTDRLSLGAEGLYVYDGGLQGYAPEGFSHAYGDIWGVALYASYKINEYCTLNGRAEKAHFYVSESAINFYEFTIGTTITPFPKDPWGSGLKIRPEARYDMTDKAGGAIPGNNGPHRDQWTFAVDVIYAF